MAKRQRAKWSAADDASLEALVRQHGRDWGRIARALGRSEHSVRLRAQRRRFVQSVGGSQGQERESTVIGDVFSLGGLGAAHGEGAGAAGLCEGARDASSVEYLRARLQQLEGENRRLVMALGEQQEIANAIATSVKAMPPYAEKYVYKAPKCGRARHNKVVAVMAWSDWHIGEVILPDETEGFGEYNWGIAQERFYTILDGFFRWVDVQRTAYPINELVFVGIGDYISGSIHMELLMTQEFPATEQAVKAGYLLGEGLRRAATHADQVRIVAVGADNHGRTFRKPQAKRKYRAGYSFVSHAVAREMTRGIKNVRWVEALGMKHVEDINGWKFLIEHGDTVRAWMGIAYYGLERRRGLEAASRIGTDRIFHYMLIGHWHVPAWVSGNILINGSLSGTSEYDHAHGRRAGPAQLAFLVHPEWGSFNIIALKDRPQRVVQVAGEMGDLTKVKKSGILLPSQSQ